MKNDKYLPLLGCLLLLHSTAFAQIPGFLPGSQFEAEIQWLADNATPETQLEDLPQEQGLVQYADSRPARTGDQAVFNVPNLVTNRGDRVTATLKAIGKHCYVYVAGGRATDAHVKKIVETFDARIYPLSTQLFGKEWSPGIDRDHRITLLLVDIKDGYNGGNGAYTTGFFYAVDEYPRSKNANSNQREMVYLDTYPTDPGNAKYLAVLAHEFQHMIHWAHDVKEYNWVNEGMSQLAQFANGFDHPEQVFNFINDSDNNMLAWSSDNTLSNYGQVYLFMYYLMGHTVKSVEGQKAFIRNIVGSKSQGIAGINAALTKSKVGKSFTQLFRNFCVANFINDRRAYQGEFGYDPNLGMLLLNPMRVHNQAPYAGHGTVKLWSARAIRIDLRGLSPDINVGFQGDKLTAGSSTNGFDVAVAFVDPSRKVAPVVKWLPIKAFRGQAAFRRPSQAHSQACLIVVNRGPEGARIEQPFARAAGSAKFSYSVTSAASTGNVARSGSASSRTTTVASRTSSSSRRPNRSASEIRQMLSVAAARPPLKQEATRVFSEDPQIQASVQTLGVHSMLNQFAHQDEEIVETIRASLAAGETTSVEEFMTFFRSCTSEQQGNLLGIRRQVLDLVQFEINQANRPDLKALLE